MLIKAGWVAISPKGHQLDEMIKAIKKVHQAGVILAPMLPSSLLIFYSLTPESPFDALSERECRWRWWWSIVKSTANRRSVVCECQNSQYLPLSYFEKLNIDSDVKLTHLAMRHGLINPKPWLPILVFIADKPSTHDKTKKSVTSTMVTALLLLSFFPLVLCWR